MRRRNFISLVGGAAAWPLAARAQQPMRLARIGFLGVTSAAQQAPNIDAFREGLRYIGYVEGRNLHIEFRFAEGDNDRLDRLAAELVGLNVDVIVTYASGVVAARRATATIPIVMASFTDPVAIGLVPSLAHPGGNITGSTFFLPELMAKRLEFIKEVAPSMTQVGVFLFLNSQANSRVLELMEGTAKALKVRLQLFEISRPTEFDSTFLAATEKQINAIVVMDHPFFVAHSDVIAALAAKHRLPSIGYLELAASGGLVAYGVNQTDQFRRAAVFVDKILKGAKPGDIPIEQATRFVTIVNVKTAKIMGIEVPTQGGEVRLTRLLVPVPA
jgi:putative tryptophan/tyrosine transport system substrate-binding protein